jgi:hypothetical protein
MDAVVAAHDSAVQVVDTLIVRIHQQGATAKWGADGGLDLVLISRAAASHPNSMRSLTGMAPRSRLNSRAARKATWTARPTRLGIGLGGMLVADKGFDATLLREAVGVRGSWANILPHPICFSKHHYKGQQPRRAFLQAIPPHHHAIRQNRRTLPRRSQARFTPRLDAR